MTDKKSIEVVAAVLLKDGKIYATQRGYGPYKDKWEFPGGKIERGETREHALEREIKEELDTEIEVGDYLCTVEYDYPDFYLTMHCFLCDVVSGELTLLEHEDAKWLEKNGLWSVDWLAADIEVVKVLENRL